MGTMTFAEAVEAVLADTRRAMRADELWAEIEKRGLVESEGQPPEATLYTTLMRKSMNWRPAGDTSPRRFYRSGDGGIGLWAHLSPAQQRAMLAGFEQPGTLRKSELDKLLAEYIETYLAKDEVVGLGDAPRFQYIITTTTEPPDELRAAPFLAATLSGGDDSNRLFRRSL